MTELTRGEIEAALANAMIQFEKEHMGRGPVETKAYIIEDMILVRLRGILTPAEVKLAQTPEGHALIKQLRRQLLEGARSLLEQIVEQTTGSRVISLHTDISVKTGERVIVFTLAHNLEERFSWGKRAKATRRS
ncbi:MAG: DUF2294 domain-containing protein [Anaerolineae bacterium]|nr:DUF2294 domain-containing protein [Anaerolineae bacterium]